MGLFDGFVGTTVQLTPKVCLAAGMIYISAADGHLDPSERADMVKVIPEDPVYNAGLDFVRRNPYPVFLQQAAAMLSPQQKLALILNAADMAMGNGHLAPQEQQMLMMMAQAFQIPDAHLTPYVQTLMLKNNLSVFGNV